MRRIKPLLLHHITESQHQLRQNDMTFPIKNFAVPLCAVGTLGTSIVDQHDRLSYSIFGFFFSACICLFQSSFETRAREDVPISNR